MVIAGQLNQDTKMWEKSDNLKDYQKEVDDSIWNSLKEVVSEGMEFAKENIFKHIDSLRTTTETIAKAGVAVGSAIIKGAKFIGKLFY